MALGWLLNLGFAGAPFAPGKPGIEWTNDENTMHYTLQKSRAHFTLIESRQHTTLIDEDTEER